MRSIFEKSKSDILMFNLSRVVLVLRLRSLRRVKGDIRSTHHSYPCSCIWQNIAFKHCANILIAVTIPFPQLNPTFILP